TASTVAAPVASSRPTSGAATTRAAASAIRRPRRPRSRRARPRVSVVMAPVISPSPPLRARAGAVTGDARGVGGLWARHPSETGACLWRAPGLCREGRGGLRRRARRARPRRRPTVRAAGTARSAGAGGGTGAARGAGAVRWARRSRRPRAPARAGPVRAGRLVRGAAVGPVEARSLEDHAHGVEQLSQPTTALRAVGEGVLLEGLVDVERDVAVAAPVRIGGHRASVRNSGNSWHSTPRSARFRSRGPPPG